LGLLLMMLMVVVMVIGSKRKMFRVESATPVNLNE
jgi:hypothetical protein